MLVVIRRHNDNDDNATDRKQLSWTDRNRRCEIVRGMFEKQLECLKNRKNRNLFSMWSPKRLLVVSGNCLGIFASAWGSEKQIKQKKQKCVFDVSPENIVPVRCLTATTEQVRSNTFIVAILTEAHSNHAARRHQAATGVLG